jgi:hypothetical protein
LKTVRRKGDIGKCQDDRKSSEELGATVWETSLFFGQIRKTETRESRQEEVQWISQYRLSVLRVIFQLLANGRRFLHWLPNIVNKMDVLKKMN